MWENYKHGSARGLITRRNYQVMKSTIQDHLLKLGLLSSLTVASSGYSKSARYMIPKGTGNYLSEDLVLEASKVRLEQDLNGQVVFLSYRFPREIEGEAARTIRSEERRVGKECVP